MTEESSGTNPLDHIKGTTPKQNKLGMETEEYNQYKQCLVDEYANSNKSLREITTREQEWGIKLYPDRLRRWLIKADVRIKPQKEVVRQIEGGGRSKSIYIRNDQADMLEQFGSISDITRVALDILLGIPTSSIVLFLSEYKSVIFIDDEDGVQTYITAELTDMEAKVIQMLTNKVEQHGLHYVEHFAVENELKYYGGE